MRKKRRIDTRKIKRINGKTKGKYRREVEDEKERKRRGWPFQVLAKKTVSRERQKTLERGTLRVRWHLQFSCVIATEDEKWANMNRNEELLRRTSVWKMTSWKW